MAELNHYSVMKQECIDALEIKNNGVYFDGTLGGGGHSYEILKQSAPNGKLFATDLDDYALERAKDRLKEFGGRFTLIKSNFKNFLDVKKAYAVDCFDGIILDLGVSSFQLDDRERGFSYMADDVSLDMRMNKDNPLTAEFIVNNYQEEHLKKIFFEYGEERFSSNVAKNIILKRKDEPIRSVGQLNQIILESIPRKFQKEGHPSKRIFQALRIEVNAELEGLYDTIISMARSLKKGGKIVILTFHSLEDRIVKNAFKYLECDCICDKKLPVCVCDKRKEVEIITKHPITAGDEELQINSRSKSAKLRVAKKI